MVIWAAMGVPVRWDTRAQKRGMRCSRAAMVKMRDWPSMFTSSAVEMPTSAMNATTYLRSHTTTHSQPDMCMHAAAIMHLLWLL